MTTDRQHAHPPPARSASTVPGKLVVLLLLTAFAYGVYHYFESTGTSPTFRMGPIESNLEAIYVGAQAYFIDHPDAGTVSFEELRADGYVEALTSHYGEAYDSIHLGADDLSLSVQLPEGPSLSYEVTSGERARLRRSLAGEAESGQ